MILSSLLTLETAARSAGDRIVIISDTHLLAPELVTPGSAIDRAEASEFKMMALSDEIMGAITDSILALNPKLVLITGDLTNNGESLSHERMVEHLNRMAANGIQPLVIPGNHDCNNPGAVSYNGDNTLPTATVTREEFAQIYRNFGYGKTSRRDPSSLSYCCEPIKGVVMIGIDSNMDELNQLMARGDSVNTYHSGGQIKPETLQWVVEQATQAKSQGKQVIAMMHHHLVPHFERQDQLLGNYIIARHDTVAKQLLEAGVHTIFTGHLHVTDAATQQNAERTDSIVEISTGSAICYPFAMRVATLDRGKKKLDVVTRWLNATQSCPDLRALGRQRIINATPVVASMISGKAWSKLGGHVEQLKKMLAMGGGEVRIPETQQQATQLALRHLREVLSRTMLAIVEGNEGEKDVNSIIEQAKQGIHAMIEEVVPNQADNLWNFFLEAVYPKLEPMMKSVLEDHNAVGTSNETCINDLTLTVTL